MPISFLLLVFHIYYISYNASQRNSCILIYHIKINASGIQSEKWHVFGKIILVSLVVIQIGSV